VLDVVDQLGLGPFLKAYRADGHGRAAYEPRMLLAVLLYGYCTGIRSSRHIERRCHEDIALRALSGNSTLNRHGHDGSLTSRSDHGLAGAAEDLAQGQVRREAVTGSVRTAAPPPTGCPRRGAPG
jgi:transposase